MSTAFQEAAFPAVKSLVFADRLLLKPALGTRRRCASGWLHETLANRLRADLRDCAGRRIITGDAGQSQAADPEPKHILMLHSFGLRFKPWTDHARIARSEITRQSQTPIDFQDHSLVDARQFNEKSEASFAEYLHNLYDDRPPTLLLPSVPPLRASSSAIESGFFREYRWCSHRWSNVAFSGTS